ncbi:hypothetical protein Rhe02_49580 [Rhizocola hellebori]|uniref:Spherulation-specific family 4 n=1 Tax=Rhizocola hellebori TaxID=1392758 RepID=A0A8J3QCD0_9ACTN|nr:spherulation-specific family 4 protein [Rhizocola hellebori]GIH06891.1 hypothetical protein Rhe02_49580 [Rhizocola hellebori]
MTVLLPLYIHPLESPAAWETVALAGPGVTAIINVHNGPGADAAYADAASLLHAARVPMLGYVDLDYGRRPRALIESDIVAWQRYPVAGIFFDQAPSDPALLSWTAGALRRAPGVTVLNPGTRPHPGYPALADLICTFEGPWTAYHQLPGEPDFGNAAHLVYGVPPSQLGPAHALLAARCGTGLVTDLEAPLPYRGIPSWLPTQTHRPPPAPIPNPTPQPPRPSTVPQPPVPSAVPRPSPAVPSQTLRASAPQLLPGVPPRGLQPSAPRPSGAVVAQPLRAAIPESSPGVPLRGLQSAAGQAVRAVVPQARSVRAVRALVRLTGVGR